MKKNLVKLGVSLLAVFLFSGAVFAADQVTLTLGHIVKPDGPVAIAAVRFAELVKERTEGKIIIEVYDSSTLGSQRVLRDSDNVILRRDRENVSCHSK